MNILHGLTGSVASILLNKIKGSYNKNDKIKFIFTESSKNFVDLNKWWIDYSDDKTEWDEYRYDKKVHHIELVKWADVFVIAPCSANTLAKIANGICDNLLTSCARAWDFDKKIIVAPSMNTKMFNHPITQEHIQKIQSWGIQVVAPVEKVLFCGDTGIGAMADIEEILKLSYE